MTSTLRIRPPQIRLALGLILASILVFGPIVVALDFEHIENAMSAIAEDASAFWVSVAFGVTICGALLYMIYRGHNWARIVFALMYAIGVVAYLPDLSARLSRSISLGVVGVLQYAMQGFAIYLLFSAPGKQWFRPDTSIATPASLTNDSKRSTFVSVSAWLLIVFSAVSCLAALAGAASVYASIAESPSDQSFTKFFFNAIFSGKPPPALDYVIDHAFALLSAAAAASLALLASSVGLLRRQPWARFAIMALMVAIVVAIAAAFGGIYMLMDTFATLGMKDLSGEERALAETGIRGMWTGLLVLALLFATPFIVLAIRLRAPEIRREFTATRQ